MMTAEIITMPGSLDALAAEIRQIESEPGKDRARWVDNIIRLSIKLAEAKARLPDNRQFSDWLTIHTLMEDYSPHDRAALIQFGQKPEIARRVLEETNRSSLQHIWRENSQHFILGHVTNNEPCRPESAESPPTPPPVEKPVGESPVPTRRSGPKPKTAVVHPNSPLRGLPRANEVIAIFTEPNTRTTLGKVCCAYGGRAIWDLILDTIDAGLLTTNHAAIRVANLRLLFPAAPTTGYVQRFDLTKAADRKIIRDVILPAAAANREAVSANPADLERIVARHGQPDPVVLKAARQEAALKRATDAGQQKIVAFGEVMWPHEQGLYDYDQIRCAIWLLQDFEILFKAPANQSPGSRADYIKVSMIWLNQYIARMKTTVPAEQHADKMLRVLAMLHKLADLMQRNPTGECVFPYSPKVEGEW